MNKLEKHILLTILIILVIIASIMIAFKYVESRQADKLKENNIKEVISIGEEETQDNTENEEETNIENDSQENSDEPTEPIDQNQTEPVEPVTKNQTEPTEKTEKTSNNGTPYYIKVNYTQNVVTIYGKDSEGNYTKPVKAMVCSTGTATPKSGTYSITNKYTWRALYGGVYGQYSCRIVGSILFHSVPYTKNGDKSSLEYWEYDKLGTTASAGCIRLTVEDAKWIYDNCASGTKVEFYSDSNPGPLGKPTAQKISSYEEVRGWDPTDPDKANPWKNYTPTSETPQIVDNQPDETNNDNEKNEDTDKSEVENSVTDDLIQENP